MSAAGSHTGRLILIVGPSGAGKDTLIDHARGSLIAEPNVRFVQRTITRPASVGEDHAPMKDSEFAQVAREGHFALSWQAHGLYYGLPVIIDQWLGGGLTLVANGSRAMLREAKTRYPSVEIVNITAAPEILAARLAARSRESADGQKKRMARAAEIPAEFTEVITIDNSGTIETAGERLIAFILNQDIALCLSGKGATKA